MSIKRSIIKSLIFLSLMFFVVAAVSADTIKLKDGSVLKGKVVSYSQGKFTIIVYIGGSPSRHILSIEEIDTVEFDPTTDLASATAQSGGLSPVSQADSSGGARLPVDSAPAPAPANDLPPTPAGPTTVAEKSLEVAAAADWTSTGIRVQRGHRVLIDASGEVGLGNSKRSGPEGLGLSDSRKLIPSRPTGALIAVVGDDNDDFVYIGSSGEFVSNHTGILFLSINEGNLKDNSGAFSANVKVISGK